MFGIEVAIVCYLFRRRGY